MCDDVMTLFLSDMYKTSKWTNILILCIPNLTFSGPSTKSMLKCNICQNVQNPKPLTFCYKGCFWLE